MAEAMIEGSRSLPCPRFARKLLTRAGRLAKLKAIEAPASDMLSSLQAGTLLLSLDSKNNGKGIRVALDSDNDSESDSDEDDNGEDEEFTDESDHRLSDEYSVDADLDEQKLLAWLNGPAQAHILNKYNPNMDCVQSIPGMRPSGALKAHQLRAAAVACNSLDSDLKGVIIADHPGLGKTLAALAAIAVTRRTRGTDAYGPCVIVSPVSCCGQWVTETRRFFEDDHLQVLRLGRESISPTELCKFDIVVTSYNYVASELTRAAKFKRAMRAYQMRPTSASKLPKRPTLSLLSDIFVENTRKMGHILVLDEAHIVKNERSRSYAAAQLLRSMFDSCIMLTATPLDNTWLDAFALLSFLESIPVESVKQMRQAFVPKTIHKQNVPSGKYLVRLVRCLDACTLRRPKNTARDEDLPVSIEKTIDFNLDSNEEALSNREFLQYKLAQGDGGKKKGKKRTSKGVAKSAPDASELVGSSAATAPKDANRGPLGFGRLIRAQQYANHPKLVDIIALDKEIMEQSVNDDNPAGDIELDTEAQEVLKNWRSGLEVDGNWKSSRVTAIADTVRKHHELRPQDAFIIMDESVYFLDIVRIALGREYVPLPCWMYDGRADAIERDIILKQFYAAFGPRILLASRGTGGLGLNLQCANVIIQCGPWWKRSWEDQARGRVERSGQTRPVFVYSCRALNCFIEAYKIEKRDRKNQVNSAVLSRIENPDTYNPQTTRECR